MDKHKLILPISILLGCIILGGFYYSTEKNKQESIERQQILKQMADKELEEKKMQADKELEESKMEQSKKEYVAKRKDDCLNIYETEGKKYNNVRSWRYSEEDDQCYLRYKDPKPKSEAECDENYPVGGEYKYIFYRENSLCKEGEFENSF